MHRTIEQRPVAASATPFGRIIHRFVVVFAFILAVLACAQPFLAGWGLDGNSTGFYLHGLNSKIIGIVGVILFLLSILWWRPGRGTVWAPIFMLVFLAAGVLQAEAGLARLFSLHVPLGVTLIIAALAVFGLSLRLRPGVTISDSELHKAG